MGVLTNAFSVTQYRSDSAAGGQASRLAGLWESMGFGSGTQNKSGLGVTYKKALKLSAVYNAVDQISSSLGVIPFNVFKRTAEGRERDFSHPVDRLLRSEPDGENGFLTPFIFKKISQTSVLLRGNCLWQIKTDGGGNQKLKYIPWDDVHDIRKLKQPNGDTVLVYMTKEGNLLANEVLHFKGWTFDGIIGVSVIHYGASQMGVEKELHEEAVKEMREFKHEIRGVGVPRFMEKRFAGQSVTQDGGQYGAALVDTDKQPLIEFLRPRPIVETLGARYITGLTGNLSYPVNEGGITAYWEGEIEETPNSKNKYTNRDSSPKRLSAAVLLTLQNLMQAVPDLEKLTLDEMKAVVELKLDDTVISGSGVGYVPTGILNASGTNSVSVGANGGAPTFAQIVSAGVKVRQANAVLPGARFGWLINPETTGKLQTTQKVDGQAIMLMDDALKLNGYPAAESTLVPNSLTKGTGTNLSAAIFGDWSQVHIHQWGWYDLTIDEITKKKQGQIEIIINMFADIFIRQPKAFTIIKDWATV